MLPETHPLIEKVTEPLAANAERHLAANALLGESLDETHPAVAETLARMERLDGKRFPRLWRFLLHVCAWFAFLLLVDPVVKMRQTLEAIGLSEVVGSKEIQWLPENLTPSQRLLLGDPALPILQQRELLHLSEPDRADFYTEYVGSYAYHFKKLPDDYLEITARIDPDNAFHLYNAAVRNGGDSIVKVEPLHKRQPRYSKGKRIRELGDEKVWKIQDEAKFNEALELIAKAATLARFDAYETSLMAARLPLFPQDRILPRTRKIAYAAGQTTQMITLRKVADLISAKAYFLSLAGNREDFLKLHADSEALIAHFVSSPENHMIGELIFTVSVAITADAFHFGAQRLGLSELAGEMQRRRQAFIDDANMKEHRKDTMEEHLEARGSLLSMLSGGIARQVASPPPFDPESLTPGRLSESDFFSSALLAFSVVILGLAAVAAFLLRELLSRSVKIISKRFDLLLRPADWLWVMGAVVFTISFTLLITRYTSLGGRDFSMRHNKMLFPALHHLLLLLLLLTIPPLVIRWRLGKRLDAFGMAGSFRPILLAPLVFACLALLIAHPVIQHFSHWQDKWIMLPFALLGGAWGIAIMIGFFSVHFGEKSLRIARAAVLSALPTALSLSVILLSALIPIYRESAERWIARDEFTAPVAAGITGYEAEVARQKRRETKAILGYE